MSVSDDNFDMTSYPLDAFALPSACPSVHRIFFLNKKNVIKIVVRAFFRPLVEYSVFVQCFSGEMAK